MFDWYVPSPAIPCTKCGKVLEWQGGDGPCALMVFRQGTRGAVEQRVSDECRSLSADDLGKTQLSPEFRICSWCFDYRFSADCQATDGVWTHTTLNRAAGVSHSTGRGQGKADRWPPTLPKLTDQQDDQP